jgi:hypothetical protein
MQNNACIALNQGQMKERGPKIAATIGPESEEDSSNRSIRLSLKIYENKQCL